MENKIRNQAQLEVRLCDRRHVVSSDEVVVQPIRVEIKHLQPCRFVLENDCVRYTVKISNKSETEICDVMFRDTLHGNAEYIPNSFRINGHPHRASIRGKTLEACIRVLKPCETLIAIFDVRIREHCNCNQRDNRRCEPFDCEFKFHEDRCETREERHECGRDNRRESNFIHSNQIRCE